MTARVLQTDEDLSKNSSQKKKCEAQSRKHFLEWKSSSNLPVIVDMCDESEKENTHQTTNKETEENL